MAVLVTSCSMQGGMHLVPHFAIHALVQGEEDAGGCWQHVGICALQEELHIVTHHQTHNQLNRHELCRPALEVIQSQAGAYNLETGAHESEERPGSWRNAKIWAGLT